MCCHRFDDDATSFVVLGSYFSKIDQPKHN